MQNPTDVRPAMERALKFVKEKKLAALVDVVSERVFFTRLADEFVFLVLPGLVWRSMHHEEHEGNTK